MNGTTEKISGVDADGHVCEPVDLWQKYLEPKYRSRAVRLEETPQGEGLFIDDQRCIELLSGKYALFSGVGHPIEKQVRAGRYLHPEITHPGAYEPRARLEVMDQQGIDIAFLYPTLGLFWPCEVRDFELAAACSRAYNDWIHEFCQADPARIKPIALIHLGDVTEAVKEVRRVAKLGFAGVYVGPKVFHNGHPFLGDSYYDLFWAEVQECNLTAGVHIVFPQEEFTWRGSGYPESGLFGMDWFALVNIAQPIQKALASMMTCGTFYKFPRLRVILAEAKAGWIANFLEQLDSKYKLVGYLERDLKMLPSEFFARNCWIGIDADERTVKTVIDLVGPEKFLFASDFPHGDAHFYPIEETEESLAGLPDPTIERILRKNALEAYAVS